MELTTIENGQLKYTPQNGVYDGRLVSNLDSEMLIELGFDERHIYWFPDPILKENETFVWSAFEFDNKKIVEPIITIIYEIE